MWPQYPRFESLSDHYFALLTETALHDGTTKQLVATLITKKLSMRISARKRAVDIGPDRLVVRTLRCGRSNPGSNPGLDRILFCTVDGKSLSRRHNRITGTNSDNEKTLEQNKCEKKGR